MLSCEGMKVLIVDDIQDYLEALGRALSGDYEVILAASLEEAKARFSNEIDLALVDVRLSESDRSNRDGLALLEWIRSVSPNTPVVMMTAYSDADAIRLAAELGATDFLKKPIQISALKALTASLKRGGR